MKEIVEPRGAIYELRDIPLGDPTLSVVEIWGSEYQENNAILVRPECLELVSGRRFGEVGILAMCMFFIFGVSLVIC